MSCLVNFLRRSHTLFLVAFVQSNSLLIILQCTSGTHGFTNHIYFECVCVYVAYVLMVSSVCLIFVFSLFISFCKFSFCFYFKILLFFLLSVQFLRFCTRLCISSRIEKQTYYVTAFSSSVARPSVLHYWVHTPKINKYKFIQKKYDIQPIKKQTHLYFYRCQHTTSYKHNSIQCVWIFTCKTFNWIKFEFLIQQLKLEGSARIEIRSHNLRIIKCFPFMFNDTICFTLHTTDSSQTKPNVIFQSWFCTEYGIRSSFLFFFHFFLCFCMTSNDLKL